MLILGHSTYLKYVLFDNSSGNFLNFEGGLRNFLDPGGMRTYGGLTNFQDPGGWPMSDNDSFLGGGGVGFVPPRTLWSFALLSSTLQSYNQYHTVLGSSALCLTVQALLSCALPSCALLSCALLLSALPSCALPSCALLSSALLIIPVCL